MIRLILFCKIFIFLFQATATHAEFLIISQKEIFVEVISGKELKRPFVSLRVSDSGSISGSSLSLEVSGNWTWENGYFCRDLFWGKRDLGYNCQQVSLENDKIRFTSDQGSGDFADFTLH